MKKPIIGITTGSDLTTDGYPATVLQWTYINAIKNANGIPLMIPSELNEVARTELLQTFDGFLFSGGGDISGEYYDGQQHQLISNVDFGRDNLEMSLMQAVIDQDIPFLGICRGLQVLNVAMGGTLFSDIASQKSDPIKHDYLIDYNRDYLAHKVEIVSGSKIHHIFGNSVLEVNSLHHQGVQNLAIGLNEVGFAPDGLVEALELPDHKFGLAVQWHPECLTAQSSMRQLFYMFIEAARDSI
jgi:putative glutamine amidotransferase